VVVAAYFDEFLLSLLPNPNPKESFYSRIERAFKAGYVSAIEQHDLHVIRELRNSFAHNMRVSRFDADRAKQVESLTIWQKVSKRPYYRKKMRSPRQRLLYVAAAISARFINRKGKTVLPGDDPALWTAAYPPLTSF